MAKAKRSFLPTKSSPRTVEWLWANTSFQDKYPAVYELLASGLAEGEVRKGATITLFCVDGRLKACIADRHTENALWITLEPFEDVLGEIEVAVAKADAEWKSTHKGGVKPVF
jgi:hypothetical protein